MAVKEKRDGPPGPNPAKKAPVINRDEEKGEITIEVDKTKAKKPYRFLSYSTARKVGISQTAFGGFLISLNSLTIQPETMYIEIYVFFIPGLLVIFAGSFAIRATKVKHPRIRSCLVLASVVFSFLGLAASLVVETRACLILLSMAELNILVLLLQVVAIGVPPVCILQMIICLDSVFCGKHRPGYSMTLTVVYKIGKTGDKNEKNLDTDDNPKSETFPERGSNDAVLEEKLDVQSQETIQIRGIEK